MCEHKPFLCQFCLLVAGRGKIWDTYSTLSLCAGWVADKEGLFERLTTQGVVKGSNLVRQ
jgi:hypothetical protein